MFTELREQVVERSQAQGAAMSELAAATRGLKEAKETLQNRIAEGTLDGRIIGKNAEAREAAARLNFGNEYNAVLVAEERFEAAKLSLDLAKLALEETRLLIRSFEAEAALQ